MFEHFGLINTDAYETVKNKIAVESMKIVIRLNHAVLLNAYVQKEITAGCMAASELTKVLAPVDDVTAE